MQKMSNPVFRSVENSQSGATEYGATYTGISIKTGILLLVSVLSALFAANLIKTNQLETVITILAVTGIAAFISVLLATFIPRLAMPFSMLYSAAIGFELGVLTVLVELLFPGQGIGQTAIVATMVIFGVMLALYSFRIVRVTNGFVKFMLAVMFAILIFSLLSFIIPSIGNLFANNFALGVGLVGFLILYGAFMLMLDFNRAEAMVTAGVDKRYEWSVALGLMVTIVWIYVQVIRLLILIAARNND
ncbi:MAG: Bax inhibitor-1/YccA family protein [Acholeplasma sp.]|nr:Bax inhibitor-1/YccA family protein [Acholeplasma sp.]